VACAPQYVADTSQGAQDIPVRRAFFATNPSVLHQVFRDGCNNPGDRFTQPNRQTARCNMLPTPEGAAFLISEFDARLEVPKLVVQKVTHRTDAGYEVEMSYFAEIRNKAGVQQHIYMPRRTLDRQIDLILTNSGGRIED
jgi:hypothetical protein